MLPRTATAYYTGRVFLHELRQPVGVLPGAGPHVSARLARLGISTVAELLTHYPREYEDRSRPVPFSRFAEQGMVLTLADVTRHEWFGFGRMRTLKIFVRDETSEAVLICFNRPFLEKSFPPGSRVVVHGKFQFKYGEIQSTSFDVEPAEAGKGVERGLVPLYPSTEGLQQGTLRRLARAAIAHYGRLVENDLGPDLIAQRGLLPKAEALRLIHFPADAGERDAARRTLAYEELFMFQLAIAGRIRERRATRIERKAATGILVERLLARLPYTLTPDQAKVLGEMRDDLQGPHPMARLLQGDVGSGKTIVALLASLLVVERGGQVAIMAPTELLARQHARTAAALVEPLGVRLAFLSGNVDDAARPPLLSALASGEVDIVIGTHALFSDEVRYRSLDLVVIDEQHRFGVLQREALRRKGSFPDLLMMSATPIPRSLALTLFGDLSVSSIHTMPEGRKPVVTHLAKQENEAKVHEFVRSRLAQGRQAFFVYPVIGEGGGSGDLKSAEESASRLSREVFPEFKVSLLHSKLKEETKRRIMDDFVSGSVDILVATTVVEVGVDVPNATIMVVEHAERFGLSALHQLRGRIGRGAEQGYCFLMYSDQVTEDAVQRLKALYGSTDGFALAEEDLKIRGPGELLGTAQSGAFRLAIADPVKDMELLKLARADAFALVRDDPGFLMSGHGMYRRSP